MANRRTDGTHRAPDASLRVRLGLVIAGLVLATAAPFADDWPEFRGTGRRGVWTETGIVDRLPTDQLKILWRAPVSAGYSGPAVAGGRVFVTDFVRSAGARGVERILAFDEKSGALLWKQEWEANYGGIAFENGPHATPTVDRQNVYALGASGVLVALNAATGQVLWKKDYAKDYGADAGQWGFSSAPIVDGNRLIALIGGKPDAKVVAFDTATGKEIWRALRSDAAVGGSQPLLVEAGGTRQLIVWDATTISSLNPETGAAYWAEPFLGTTEMNIAMAHNGSRLLMTTFYEGPLMLELDNKKPAARVLWKGNSKSEVETDKLHATITTPIIDGDYIYGICSYGQLRALDARTGERLWETQAVTVERARWASAQLVRNGDRVFITNDRGELILARVSPKGYEEIGRTPLLKPTTDPRGRRRLGAVNWSSPAYANKHVYVRNDEELIVASLAAEDYPR
jgi:outer membrane protein assembly factor BamB